MTVSSIIPVNNYVGNDSVTVFDFDFLIESAEELLVTHISENEVSTVLQYGIDYSVNEIGNSNGSYITFPLPGSSFDILNSNETLSLSLNLEIKQESKFENSSYLDLSVLEWTFDYIVRILQMLSRKVERCLKMREGTDDNPDDMVNTIAEWVEDSFKNASIAEQYAEDAKAVINENICWGKINGDIINQNDLYNILNTKAEITLCNEIAYNKICESFILGSSRVNSDEDIYNNILNYYNSGSGTGKDIIKDVNYSVSGSPDIEDNILNTSSDYDETNYINNMSVDLKDANEKGINISFEYELNSVTNKYILDIQAENETDSVLRFGIDTDGALYIQMLKNGTLQGQGNFNEILVAETKYKISFSGQSGVWSAKLYEMTDDEYSLSETITFNAVFSLADNLSNIVWDYTNIADYKFYLDSLKIEKNNQLFFSPQLVIEYVISQTGSKIADVYYRNIVEQLYNETGYAPYYTIDEENENYTLPMCGVYQMIEQNNLQAVQLVETYLSDDSTSGYRLYNDGWCEQWGYINAASGIDITVNFLKPYINNNYSIFVTARAASGYTPSAWIRTTKNNSSCIIVGQCWSNASYTGSISGIEYMIFGYVE